MGLRVIPLTLAQANAFVREHHRHHKPVVGHRFSVGAELDGKLVAVAIVGRPVARRTDPYRVAEVTRLASDGTRNACSMLYSASARAAAAMGYNSIQTFTLEEEPGTSLRAAGWTFDGIVDAGDPDVGRRGAQLWLDGRTRRGDQPMGPKRRWVKRLGAP